MTMEKGRDAYGIVKELFPICRSISGNGVRRSLDVISKHVPIEISEIPSGTRCFDWTVPPEWNIKDAFVADSSGRRVVDFKECNLHVVGYSEPVSGDFTLEELKPHLHFDESRPDAIPYITSYYKRRWGFCVSKDFHDKMRPDRYHVEIDSSLDPDGSLTYAEAFVPGESGREIVFSSYLCHPSMANDSISGVALNAMLFKHVSGLERRRYSYRFLFIPETIGAIAYLSRNRKRVIKNTYCGMVLTCVGDGGKFHYKRTRCGHDLDRLVENVLRHSGKPHEILDFFLPGSDERQFSSPGFNLPFGSLMRSVYGSFHEYHSSLDDLSFVSPEALGESFGVYAAVVEALEGNRRYVNLKPHCEPFLSKYGLYDTLGGRKHGGAGFQEIFYVLNFSDGSHSLVDIADKMGRPVSAVIEAASLLSERGLLREAGLNKKGRRR